MHSHVTVLLQDLLLVLCRVQHYSSQEIYLGESLLIDNGVVQISVIEVSFLVGFLAYLYSLGVCADIVEVPTANFEAVDVSWRQPTAANVNFWDELNDPFISVISVRHAVSMLIQPVETGVQYHSCMLKDYAVGQITLTLSAEMI